MGRFDIVTSRLRGPHVSAMLSMFGCLASRRLVTPRGTPADDPHAAAVTRTALVSAWLGLVIPRLRNDLA